MLNKRVSVTGLQRLSKSPKRVMMFDSLEDSIRGQDATVYSYFTYNCRALSHLAIESIVERLQRGYNCILARYIGNHLLYSCYVPRIFLRFKT